MSWVLLLLPLHFALCIGTLLPCPSSFKPSPSLLPGDSHGWTPLQRLFLPLVKRFIWALTDIGGAPQLTPEQERSWSARIVALQHAVFGDEGSRDVQLEVEDCYPGDEAWKKEWIKGEAVDPRGLVKPGAVPMFWFEKSAPSGKSIEDGAWRSRRARAGERVVLYFVGGGYCHGECAKCGLLLFRCRVDTSALGQALRLKAIAALFWLSVRACALWVSMW